MFNFNQIKLLAGVAVAIMLFASNAMASMQKYIIFRNQGSIYSVNADNMGGVEGWGIIHTTPDGSQASINAMINAIRSHQHARSIDTVDIFFNNVVLDGQVSITFENDGNVKWKNTLVLRGNLDGTSSFGRPLVSINGLANVVSDANITSHGDVADEVIKLNNAVLIVRSGKITTSTIASIAIRTLGNSLISVIGGEVSVTDIRWNLASTAIMAHDNSWVSISGSGKVIALNAGGRAIATGDKSNPIIMMGNGNFTIQGILDCNPYLPGALSTGTGTLTIASGTTLTLAEGRTLTLTSTVIGNVVVNTGNIVNNGTFVNNGTVRVPYPTVVAGQTFTYNGATHTLAVTKNGLGGTNPINAYTIINGSAVEPGTRTASAKLNPGYTWSDGSTADHPLGSWTIQTGTPPAAPSAANFNATHQTDDALGSITISSIAYNSVEYINSSGGIPNEWTTPASSTISNLEAGTYLFRVKDNYSNYGGNYNALSVVVERQSNLTTLTYTIVNEGNAFKATGDLGFAITNTNLTTVTDAIREHQHTTIGPQNIVIDFGGGNVLDVGSFYIGFVDGLKSNWKPIKLTGEITGSGWWTIFANDVISIKSEANIANTNGFYAIWANSTDFEIIGGKIIGLNNNLSIAASNSDINISGGLIFTAREAFYNDNSDIEITGDAVVIEWNKQAWEADGKPPYAKNSDQHLTIQPASANAHWDVVGGKFGISYENGSNSDFIEIEGVTVMDLSVNISLNRYEIYFGTQLEGYETAPQAVTVTITNDGNVPTGELSISELNNPSIFNILPPTILNILVGESATFTIQPKTGVAVGNYTSQIAISDGATTLRTVQANFSVSEVVELDISSSSSEDGNSSSSENGTPIISNHITLNNVPPGTKIEVYNLRGKRVLNGQLVMDNGKLQIPVQAKGVYIVKIGNQTQRIVVR